MFKCRCLNDSIIASRFRFWVSFQGCLGGTLVEIPGSLLTSTRNFDIFKHPENPWISFNVHGFDRLVLLLKFSPSFLTWTKHLTDRFFILSLQPGMVFVAQENMHKVPKCLSWRKHAITCSIKDTSFVKGKLTKTSFIKQNVCRTGVNTSTLCLKLLIWLPFEVPWIRVFPSAKWRQRIVKGEFREFVLNENSRNSSSDWKTYLISMPGALCLCWFLCSSYLLKEFSLELYIILFGLFVPAEMGDSRSFFLRWGGVRVKLLQKMEIL